MAGPSLGGNLQRFLAEGQRLQAEVTSSRLTSQAMSRQTSMGRFRGVNLVMGEQMARSFAGSVAEGRYAMTRRDYLILGAFDWQRLPRASSSIVFDRPVSTPNYSSSPNLFCRSEQDAFTSPRPRRPQLSQGGAAAPHGRVGGGKYRESRAGGGGGSSESSNGSLVSSVFPSMLAMTTTNNSTLTTPLASSDSNSDSSLRTAGLGSTRALDSGDTSAMFSDQSHTSLTSNATYPLPSPTSQSYSSSYHHHHHHHHHQPQNSHLVSLTSISSSDQPNWTSS